MIHVRPAQPNDQETLFDLVRLFPTPTPPTDGAYSAAFRAKLLDSSSFLAVAEDGAALVGYVSGYCHTTFYAGGKTAWIDELLVVSTVSAGCYNNGGVRGLGRGEQLQASVIGDRRCERILRAAWLRDQSRLLQEVST
jgi:hypothetical protein